MHIHLSFSWNQSSLISVFFFFFLAELFTRIVLCNRKNNREIRKQEEEKYKSSVVTWLLNYNPLVKSNTWIVQNCFIFGQIVFRGGRRNDYTRSLATKMFRVYNSRNIHQSKQKVERDCEPYRLTLTPSV